jgi:outer membrane murein-binding lipoprotein Lpp
MRTMRKITIAAGMLAALALTGCASPSVTTTPDDVGTGVTVTTTDPEVRPGVARPDHHH